MINCDMKKKQWKLAMQLQIYGLSSKENLLNFINIQLLKKLTYYQYIISKHTIQKVYNKNWMSYHY